MFIWHQLLQKPRTTGKLDSQKGSLLGPVFSDEEIVTALKSQGVVFTSCDSDDQLCEQVAELIADENVMDYHDSALEDQID